MRTLIIAAFLLVGSVLRENDPIVTLPFQIHLGHIYIQGQINDGRPINIVFDTGAAANLASESVADEIGLKTSGTQTVLGASGPVSIKSSKRNRLKLGDDLALKNQDFLVMNLDHLGDPDYPIDAIIGANILNNYTVEMDFEKGLINLFPREDFPAREGYTAHSISLVPFNVPIVEGSLFISGNETISGPYLVDTGAALALRINTPTVNENELVHKVSPSYEHAGKALGNESVDKIGRLQSFTVLGESFEGVPIRMASVTSGVSSMSNVNGILGLEILKRFNTIYDYDKQVMYVKRNNLFNAPFRESKSGLKVKKYAGYLEVENVIASSAGEKAEIKPGDRILSVDGKVNLTQDQFSDYCHETKGPISLKILRKGEELTISITPFSMI